MQSTISRGRVCATLFLAISLAAPAMLFATDHQWGVNGNGLWTIAGNWVPMGSPGAGDHAFIRNLTTPSSAVVVTIPGGIFQPVNNLTIDDTGVSTKHELFVSNDTFFDVSAGIVNDGVISLNSTANPTLLRVLGSLTLSGSGRLILDDGGPNGIAATGGFTLANATTHTIEGVGNIGSDSASLINDGLILANVSAGILTLDPRNAGGGTDSFVNSGTVRASNSGVVQLTGSGFGEFGGLGTYEALAGSEVQIANSSIIRNSTFTSSGTGLVRTLNGTVTSFINITNNGSFQVGNNADARMTGTITNSGEIVLASTGSQSDFELGSNVTLTGGGTLTMSGPVAQVNAAGALTLTNSDNLIQGRGFLGGNTASIVNNALIHANVDSEVLLIDPRNIAAGTNSFVNNSTVRASGGGIVQLTGNGFGEFGGTGTYEVLDGSELQLANGTVLRDSTFSTSGTGVVRTLDGADTVLIDITNSGVFQVGNNADAQMIGTINNTGEIVLASTGSQSDFELGSNVTLTGGGTLTMTGPVAQVNAAGGYTLTNSDNLIQGLGILGGNTASIVNNALIHANVDSEVLLIDPRNIAAGTNSFVNNSTVRASGGGIVQLTGNGFGEFGGAGRYEVLDGSELQLANGTVLRDSTFSTSGTGVVRTLGGTDTVLIDITNSGVFQVGNNADAQMIGTINNTGEIVLASTGSQSDFELGSNVTLTGGGTLTMSGPVAQVNAAGAFTLTNSDNLIQGLGILGGNTASIVNNALIHANVDSEVLLIDPRNIAAGTNSFVNNSTVRASKGGIVQLTGNGFGEFGGAGTYEVLDGSELQLANGTVLRDSTFSTSGTGVVRTLGGTDTVLIDITNSGVFQVGNNADAQMTGTIANSGEIVLASTTLQSDFELGSDVTLTGGGTLTMSGPVAQVNAVGGFTLTNQNNTIQGVGNIGGNTGFYINRGTIDAAVNAGTITIDPANAAAGIPAFANEMTGVLRTRNGASLQFSGSGFGELVNRDGGRIVVESTLQLVSGAIFRNEMGGRVEGTGTVDVVSGSFTNTGGVVAPGLSTGILNFNGSFSQTTGGTLEIEIAGPTPGTEHDQLAIVGTANLGGTLEAVTIATISDPAARGDFDSFTVLVASVINGVFDDATFDGDAMGADGNLLYLGDNDQGVDGFFRGLRYTGTEVNLVNYLALAGDANADGVVDGSDFNIWNTNKFTMGTDWTTADFDGDGITDGRDFNIWNTNKFTSVAGGFRPVPEPCCVVWLVCLGPLMRRRRQA